MADKFPSINHHRALMCSHVNSGAYVGSEFICVNIANRVGVYDNLITLNIMETLARKTRTRKHELFIIA
jgi:hypothetical protein